MAKKSKKHKCPYGYKFGEDYNVEKECNDCRRNNYRFYSRCEDKWQKDYRVPEVFEKLGKNTKTRNPQTGGACRGKERSKFTNKKEQIYQTVKSNCHTRAQLLKKEKKQRTGQKNKTAKIPNNRQTQRRTQILLY